MIKTLKNSSYKIYTINKKKQYIFNINLTNVIINIIFLNYYKYLYIYILYYYLLNCKKILLIIGFE